MSIRYRLKRSSGPVSEPILAHPDAIYRPQNRPVPVNAPPPVHKAAASRVMASNPVVAAPLAASGGGGFSPGWIIGPLVALLVLMALGILGYTMKKKYDEKKQAEKENNENPENDGSARRLPIENVPLKSMKPDISLPEQKRIESMPSTSKKNPSSIADPYSSDDVKKKPSDRSVSHQAMPTDATRMAKPSSGGKDPIKMVLNSLTDPSPASQFKSMNPISNRPPTSSTPSATKNPGQSNDRPELNTGKPNMNDGLNKKENQLDNKVPSNDKKSTPQQDLSNVGGINRNEPPKIGHDIPSRSDMNNLNTANKPGDGVGYINEPNSPEQHGIGKSPLISNIPTGSKRNEPKKQQSQTNQAKNEKPSSGSLSSNPNLQNQNPSKEILDPNKSKTSASPSDINKDQHQQPTLTAHSKLDPMSKSSETTSIVSSAAPTKENNSKVSDPNENPSKSMIHSSTIDKNAPDNRSTSPVKSSNLVKPKSPTDDKSDESTTSLTKPGTSNSNKTASRLPNVPQCKTNTSSDDDDYDEYYPIPSTNQQITTNKCNSNLNASPNRKKQSAFTHKSSTKRSHTKDKNMK